MAQFAYPSGDITNPANVTGSYLDLDEGATASDSDFIYSTNNSTDTYECSLDSLTDPSSGIGHIVRWRHAQADSNDSPFAPSSGGTNPSYDAYLYQGTTLIATLVSAATPNSGSFAESSYNLTTTEANNITDYTDLRVRFVMDGSGGSPANRRAVAISWVEMEVPDAATNYTLTADGGSYSYSGTDADLLKGYAILANAGSFTFLGTDLNLLKDSVLEALSGVYSYSGTEASLLKDFAINAKSGNFSLIGTDVNLLKDSILTALGVSYSYSGQDATLSKGFTMSAESGSFTYIGIDVSLLKDSILNAESGSYSYAGQDANLNKGLILTTESGTFAFTGQDANLLIDRLLSAESGSYTLTVEDVNLLKDYLLTADSDSFGFTGQDSSLLHDKILQALQGTYGYTGQEAQLILDRLITAEPGTFLFTGQDATLTYEETTDYVLKVSGPATFVFTGTDANLIYGQIIDYYSENETIYDVLTSVLDKYNLDLKVFVDVVPVHESFPCIRYQTVYDIPFQTKDGSDLNKAMFRVDVFARVGGEVNSETKESAFSYALAVANLLKDEIKNFPLNDDIKGIRIHDIYDDYNDEANVYFTTFDITLIYEKIDYIMFSLTEKFTGSKVNGKKVYVQGVYAEAGDLIDVSPFFGVVLDSGINFSSIDIISVKKDYFGSGGSTTWAAGYDEWIMVDGQTLGHDPNVLFIKIDNNGTGTMTKVYFWIYYTKN